MEKLTKEEKNRQISKEVKISVVLYVCFFLWWYFTGYGSPVPTPPRPGGVFLRGP